MTIEVKPKLAVDLDTARVCVKLVDWFLECNEGYRLELAENDAHDGVEWRLTDEPAPRAGEQVRLRMRMADLEWAVRFMAPMLLCSCCDGVSNEEWAKLCSVLFDEPTAKFHIPKGKFLPCDVGGISAEKCWKCVSMNVKPGLEDE